MTVGENKMKSNLIPITRIYDIYPKYTYSNDVKKFMDEIVDIDRAIVFTKADIVDMLDKIRADLHYNAEMHEDGNWYLMDKWVDEILDKYKAKDGEKHE